MAKLKRTTESRFPVNPPPIAEVIGVRGIANCSAGKGRDLGVLTPGNTDLFYEHGNILSLVVKEPELVGEVEWYQLHIVGLTSK